MVIASDGVWDYASAEAVAKCVRSASSASSAAEKIVERVQRKCGARLRDDTTCVVVCTGEPFGRAPHRADSPSSSTINPWVMNGERQATPRARERMRRILNCIGGAAADVDEGASVHTTTKRGRVSL